MKLFLIDAYALIYRSYYAFIKNPRINSKGVNTSAIFGFINSLEDVLKRENPTHIAVAFDPKGPTFRHEAFEQYKAQREETPEVIRQSVPIIKEIIEAYNIPILEVPRYEADDVIGTVSKQAEKEGFDVFMMTPDKDYGQLVSEHIFMYRPKFGGDYEIMGIPEVLNKYGLTSTEQVIDLLGLMGDASDNIPGCSGVGEKTAQKLLTEFGSIENLLANTDKLKGAQKKKVEENAEQIRFSKFLATIKTDVPIEFDAARCVREKPNEERLTEIYTELEFRTFINKLSSEPVKAAPKGPVQGDLFAVFTPESTEASKKSILTDLKSTPHNYYLTDTEEKQADLARFLLGQEFFAFDTETDGIDPLKAGLVGMSFAVKENEAWYVPVPANSAEAAKVVERFSPALQNPKSLKIGQNIKFDILVLRKYNVKVAGPLFDTMIAHYLLNPELRHGMDYLAETYLKYQTVPIEELIGPKGKSQLSMRNVPVEQIAEYAAEDADSLYQYAVRRGFLIEEERDEDKIVIRGEMVKMLLDSLGYKDFAGFQGIFRCDFTDADAIPKELMGYAALSQALGLVDGGDTSIDCCGGKLKELKANTSDGATEKHVPEVEINGNIATVKVGSVFHPMTDAHYIGWVALFTNEGVYRKKLEPGKDPVVKFLLSDSEKISSVYAYCNEHGLWEKKNS